MMLKKYIPQLVVHGVRQSWRQAKRQGMQIARRALGKSPSRKTRFAGAVLPQVGTAFIDRFAPVPARETMKSTKDGLQ